MLLLIFNGIFPFSMTSDILKDFHDFSRPGNKSFKFHDFPGFPSTQLFFGGCVPHGFQNVGSREQIFLEKW